MKMLELLLIAIKLIPPIALLPQNPLNFRDTSKQEVKSDVGEIGVNLLGFHVNVGVRPVVAPNGVGGTIHAQAGTPFGQYAAVGAEGHVGLRLASGSVYAGATAGQGIAAAGVEAEGVVGSPIGPLGSMRAEAYNGDVFRGITLGNSNDQTLSMVQERVQSQTLSDTNYTKRSSIEGPRPISAENEKNTFDYISVKVEDLELPPTKPHQDSSSILKNSLIVSILQKWKANQSFTDDNSRSKFSKNDDAMRADNDLQQNENESIKKVHKDGVSQNITNTYNDKTTINEETSESSNLGILSFFRQWIQNKTITDDNSRSKFVENNKLSATGISHKPIYFTKTVSKIVLSGNDSKFITNECL